MNKLEADDVTKIVCNDERLSLQEEFLVIILYHFSDNNLRCFLNYSALRKYARCSLNSLKKYLRHLEEYGYVTPTKTNNRIEYIQLHLTS